jgi:hypothetical protein
MSFLVSVAILMPHTLSQSHVGAVEKNKTVDFATNHAIL